MRRDQLIALGSGTQGVHRIVSRQQWTSTELVHRVEAGRDGSRGVPKARGVGHAHGGLVAPVSRTVRLDVLVSVSPIHSGMELGKVSIRLRVVAAP